MTLLLTILALVSLAIGLGAWKQGKRALLKKILATPFPEEWEKLLLNEYPLYKRLPWALQEDLKIKVQLFLATKNFEGCAGFEVTDRHKVLIAAQACTLLLNRDHAVFPRLISILIYPSTFVSTSIQRDEDIVSLQGVPVEGQSSGWGQQVVLAWNHVLEGVQNEKDSHNVVFHEFAHQLDSEVGHADGVPRFYKHHGAQYYPWMQVVGEEFDKFIQRVEHHKKDVIDEYGATNGAEFFAVVTETFFEKPHKLAKMHPKLFEQFKEYYEIDPRDWDAKAL